jgi:hypothetical protein
MLVPLPLSRTRRCGACARLLPRHTGRGRPREHCDRERCATIYNAQVHRIRCARCHGKIGRDRASQRAAICGACFVDLCDLAGFNRGGRHGVE